MNLKKNFNKIALFIVIIMVFTFIFSLKSTTVASDKRENKIVEEIMESYSQGKNINIKKYNLYYDEVKSKSYYSEELLALGYYGICGEDDNAKYFLKKSIANFNSKTNFNVKYMALYLLISEMVKDNEIDDALIYIREVNKFSISELDKNCSKIKNILYLLVDIVDGRDLVIEVLEEIIKHEDKISMDTLNSYKSILGMYYIMNGQYSNATEMLLNVIDSDINFESQYTLKSIIDLGSMFSTLNKYERAEETYKSALEIGEDVNQDGKYNTMMVYAYINLYEALIYQDKVDEFFNISQEIEKYYKNVDNSILESTLINYTAIMASAYIKIGNFAEADKYIDNFTIAENSTYIDNDVFSYMVYGDYYFAKGMYDKAKEIYENAYLSKKEVLNKKYEKMILQRLINLYDLQGEVEKEAEYKGQLLKLYEEESEAVSDEYINYMISKYNYNKELNSLNRYKIILTVIVTVICAVGSIIILEYFKHRKTIRYDGLSGVYKREYFDYIFEKMFKRKKKFIIIIFDIDNFKSVNDTHGHDFGDRVLQNSAQTAKGLLDNRSKIFRYGGEEFVIISRVTTLEEGVALAEKIRAAIENNKWERGVNITISMGVANKKGNMEATFKAVDTNLYKAKESGKNKVVY